MTDASAHPYSTPLGLRESGGPRVGSSRSESDAPWSATADLPFVIRCRTWRRNGYVIRLLRANAVPPTRLHAVGQPPAGQPTLAPLKSIEGAWLLAPAGLLVAVPWPSGCVIAGRPESNRAAAESPHPSPSARGSIPIGSTPPAAYDERGRRTRRARSSLSRPATWWLGSGGLGRSCDSSLEAEPVARSGKPPVVPTTRSFRLTTATWVGQRGSYEGIGGGTSPRAWAAPRRSPALWERRA